MNWLIRILTTPWRWYKTRQHIKELRKRDPFIYK